ncbi:protein LURP-one-related 8-like [Durio zibethinus]|uniref:Protein LURP-one-related 8-like n=1 Tax=Durio zibethinus TaxID=66656 RepID=A0A6P5ZU18_DURZI|nr:protein LURP-one-related 8-like [Durio zibethinus]
MANAEHPNYKPSLSLSLSSNQKIVRLFYPIAAPLFVSQTPFLSPYICYALISTLCLTRAPNQSWKELKRLEPFTPMTKVYPNASFTGSDAISERPSKLLVAADTWEAILTVWKKSLLFNCNGFTVFDGNGDLVFRVDNYMEGNKGEILLMDATGKPLLTIRRKKMSLGDSWLVYEGETLVNPTLSVRKSLNILNNKCLAHVFAGNTNNRNNNIMYEIEGSYSQRCCAVYDVKRRLVAEIKRKEAVGGVAFGIDVFRLVVQPDNIRADFAMAFVILLDQMFGSSRSGCSI